MRVGLGIGMALLLAAAGPARAQRPALDSLKPGQTVRVRAGEAPRFVTRLGPSADELFDRAETPFQPGRVDSLWVRGNAWKTGAIVGAAIGAGGSFAFWAWFCNAISEGTGCDAWGTVAGLALAGGAGGALIGAGVGALIPTWKLRYARDREAAIGPMVGPGRIGVAVRF